MVLRQRVIIRVMATLGALSVLLGIGIALSAFIIPHSATYVKRHEIDRIMDLAGTYPLTIKETKLRKHLDSFDGCPRKIESMDISVLAAIAMFDELGYSSRFSIPRRTLVSFLLHVKEGYKDVPYHNWMHGFSAGSFAFLLIRELQLNKLLGDITSMGFLIAAFSHDLGHPGTSSKFQQLTNSDITRMFESPSLLEKYHLKKTKKLLEIHENNILQNLNDQGKEEIKLVLETSILATDLGVHLNHFNRMLDLSHGYNSTNESHRSLLLALMSTAFDLNDQTKNFENAREAAFLICKEFYAQGIREKKLGHTPELWMDPEKAYVIQDQKKFVEDVTRPVFQLLSKAFPESKGLKQCLSVVETNIAKWNALQQEFEVSTIQRSGVDLDVLNDSELVKRAEERFNNTNNHISSLSPAVA